MEEELKGIVRDGQFRRIPDPVELEALSLTTIAPQEARTPDSAELNLGQALNLSDPEGYILTVKGTRQGGWLYSARLTSAQYFRANVGAIVLNDDGRVLAVERCKKGKPGSGQWQMVQGGLDDGEEPLTAAYREINEELGLHESDVEHIGEYPEWLAYELPEDNRRAKHGRGQVQKWLVFRLLADDSNIDFGEEPEFCAFEWITMDELASRAWEVRRPLYNKLARYLAELMTWKTD